MLRRVLAAGERGSASLEFLGVGVLLLVPIALGMLALAQVEQAQLACNLAARNAARVLTGDNSGGSNARALADAHIRAAADNYHLDTNRLDVRIERGGSSGVGSSGGGGSEGGAGTGEVSVTVTYELPLVPGLGDLVRVPIQATSTFPNTRFGTP